MLYYLKIAGVGVKVNCPNNLYLFDEWKVFFEERWGKKFLVKKNKAKIKICLDGLLVKDLKVIPRTVPEESVVLPRFKNNILYFDNLLNQGYFLALLAKMIGKEILNKGGIIFHSSGVVINNKAVLIMGESGSGKTTTLKKLIGKYRAIAEDEVAVFKDSHNKLWAYPILFSSKLESNLLADDDKYEIGVILTIKKNTNLELIKMSEGEAEEFLLEQSKSLINNQERAKNIFSYIKILNNKVYTLACRKEDNLDIIMKKINYEI